MGLSGEFLEDSHTRNQFAFTVCIRTPEVLPLLLPSPP